MILFDSSTSFNLLRFGPPNFHRHPYNMAEPADPVDADAARTLSEWNFLVPLSHPHKHTHTQTGPQWWSLLFWNLLSSKPCVYWLESWIPLLWNPKMEARSFEVCGFEGRMWQKKAIQPMFGVFPSQQQTRCRDFAEIAADMPDEEEAMMPWDIHACSFQSFSRLRL